MVNIRCENNKIRVDVDGQGVAAMAELWAIIEEALVLVGEFGEDMEEGLGAGVKNIILAKIVASVKEGAK